MKFFADKVIKPVILQNGYKTICEVGASYGENTDALLSALDLSITIIDPCKDADLSQKYEPEPRVQVLRGFSLEVLPQIRTTFDCILIDGDHNWFTVYNELKIIEERQLLRPGGTIFFHDVSWPYGRRDMYFQPELIPAEYVQEYAKNGIRRYQRELCKETSFNANYNNAVCEGGARNGVLTAIEDFVADSKQRYEFFHLREESGLGVLYRKEEKRIRSHSRLRVKSWYINSKELLKQFLRMN